MQRYHPRQHHSSVLPAASLSLLSLSSSSSASSSSSSSVSSNKIQKKHSLRSVSSSTTTTTCWNWNKKEDHKHYMEWLGSQLNIKRMEDWISVTPLSIVQKGGGPLLSQYDGSI